MNQKPTVPHRDGDLRDILVTSSGTGALTPALLDRDDLRVRVWDDGSLTHREFVASHGLDLETDLEAAIGSSAAVIADGDHASCPEVLDRALAADRPVLLERAASLGTGSLERLAEDSAPGALHVAAPWRMHPGVGAMATAANSGKLGLVHAVHGELIVGGNPGSGPSGDLRDLGFQAVDVLTAILGPLRGEAFAIRQPAASGAGESWTITLRLLPDIVVTLLVARAPGTVGHTVHRYRILGSHGQLVTDLRGPHLEVIGSTRHDVPFGPRPAALLLQSFLEGHRSEPDLPGALATSLTLDALEASADSGTIHRIGETS